MKKLKDLNINKSPGPDSIKSRIFVKLVDSIASSLSIIFQNSHNTGTVISSWKEANITPIFKKGDKKDPEYYRLVSLTSILCKVMESILKDYLLDFLRENNVLLNKQYGFPPGRSTILQLLNVLDKWAEAIDNGHYNDVVYWDFVEAFDEVSHKRLVKILKYYSLPVKVIGCIKSFLTNRKQRVLVNFIASGCHDVISGVPQDPF